MLLTDATYSDSFISIAYLLFLTQRSRSPQSPFNYVIHLRSPNQHLRRKQLRRTGRFNRHLLKGVWRRMASPWE